MSVAKVEPSPAPLPPKEAKPQGYQRREQDNTSFLKLTPQQAEAARVTLNTETISVSEAQHNMTQIVTKREAVTANTKAAEPVRMHLVKEKEKTSEDSSSE